MSCHKSIVAVFSSHKDAETAIKAVQDSGYDMKNLSIVGKDFHTEEHVTGYINTGDRVKFWGKQGAFWGAVWGILFGSAFFVVPGFGPVMVFGPLVGMIISALEGATIVGGIGVIGSALYSIGIPKDSVILYETEVKAGKFLLVAQGSDKALEGIKGLLEKNRADKTQVHESRKLSEVAST